MRVLILKISEPRHGVALSLKAANQFQISKVSLLALLRSLDIMRKIQRVNFENHLSVANELVKFLAINTEFDYLKMLQSQSDEFKTDISKLQKDVANIMKTQQTIANKTNQLKADASALSKRLKALKK